VVGGIEERLLHGDDVRVVDALDLDSGHAIITKGDNRRHGELDAELLDLEIEGAAVGVGLVTTCHGGVQVLGAALWEDGDEGLVGREDLGGEIVGLHDDDSNVAACFGALRVGVKERAEAGSDLGGVLGEIEASVSGVLFLLEDLADDCGALGD
jgi:hypothetical protein